MTPLLRTGILAALFTLPVAFADFRIYIGQDNDIIAPGSTGSYSALYLLNAEPDCDDFNNSIELVNDGNDASDHGWACDGCDASQATGDWDITRLEINNSGNPCISDLPAHVTLYGTGGGTYDLTYSDDDGAQDGSAGTCYRQPSDADDVQCGSVVGGAGGKYVIQCVSILTFSLHELF